MATNNDGTISYQDYRELWNFNLQKIEHIQLAIEKSIGELENKYSDFERLYDEIMAQIDILTSIYSCYNTLDGAENVLRLRSILENYRKRYTRDGLDFNLIYRLIHRISDARDDSFEGFPVLKHGDAPTVIEGHHVHDEALSLRKYKWITFERNRSWFIAAFTKIEICTDPDFNLVGHEEPDRLHVDMGGRILVIRDIFARPQDPPASPRYFLLLGPGERNYAANRIGKRIFADRDFLAPLVRPFKKAAPNALSPGRVRLFGKNHLLLY